MSNEREDELGLSGPSFKFVVTLLVEGRFLLFLIHGRLDIAQFGLAALEVGADLFLDESSDELFELEFWSVIGLPVNLFAVDCIEVTKELEALAGGAFTNF